MDVELKVGRRDRPGGYFIYKHYTNGLEVGEVFVLDSPCKHYDSQLDFDKILHILNHEYTELFCARTLFQDGGVFWNKDGFNNMFDAVQI